MDMYEVVSALTGVPGVTGSECAGAAAKVMEYFGRFTSDVWTDTLGNVCARVGSGKPVVLICAHMDEVGLVVSDIEENGMLRLRSVAGVDPRVLPGSEVNVYTGSGVIPAVVGAVPPHLLGAGKDKAYRMIDLAADTGLTPEHVKERICVGDAVTLYPYAPLKLAHDRVAGKTFDDRALVAVMIEAFDMLKTRTLNCTVVFMATVQEERGGFGAMTGTTAVRPDFGVAIDVCHAPTPGTDQFDTAPMDSIPLTVGGNIHPGVYKMLKDAADERNISVEKEVVMGATGTDAWDMQVMLGGVPVGLISLPIRYMHTSVECMSLDTLKNCARLLTEFLVNVGADWEEKLCLDD